MASMPLVLALDFGGWVLTVTTVGCVLGAAMTYWVIKHYEA